MSTPRRLAIALAVSVGLNLFLSGMIASAWIAKRHYAGAERPAASLAGGFDVRRGFEAAGPEARPLAREIRRDHGPRLRAAGREVQAARQAVGALLRSDDLDPAALRDALAGLRRATDEAQTAMHEVLIETMTRLDAEQRRAFLDAALQRRPRPGERRPRPGEEDAEPPGAY